MLVYRVPTIFLSVATSWAEGIVDAINHFEVTVIAVHLVPFAGQSL